MTKKEIKRDWHLIDGKGKVVGRLASEISLILQGKIKVGYSPNLDCGDYVVVTNSEKVKLTGRKMDKKLYIRHSGYPGGFKQETAREAFEKHPERVLYKAVLGMLPDNKLKAERIKRLKLVVGSDNPFGKHFLKK